MALVAREILASPASEVDYKRLFNEGRDLLGIRRYAIKWGDNENNDNAKGSVKIKKRDRTGGKIDYKWSKCFTYATKTKSVASSYIIQRI
jgi:hypothetical protein